MKIGLIGNFHKFHDEEYIARSFESIGHEVTRIPRHIGWFDLNNTLDKTKPEILIFSKWNPPPESIKTIEKHRERGMKTVCWIFDLYFGYVREPQVSIQGFFKADYVFTTDGGNQKKFEKLGINHQLVRQGIYKEECFLYPKQPREHDVIFVGSHNPANTERISALAEVKENFKFKWFGYGNTDELRGTDLNKVYAKTGVVVGDSVYSPHYWSNRVVETLGRGGFLIHQDVPGLKEEYPHIVTYKRGDTKDLLKKIKYYLKNEEEREEIVKKNFEWVRDNYTMDKKCKELIQKLNFTS